MEIDDFTLAMVAKLYYVDKIKQKEISNMFNTNAMVISRMIKEAEDKGIVQIQIRTPDRINLDMSKRLKEKYNLKDCVVLENSQDFSGDDLVAKFLAKYVMGILPENGILGVSWGNTISKFADHLSYQNREDCTVLELTGGFYARNGEMKTPTGIIIKICQKIRAEHCILNAPYYVQSLEAKKELKQDENNMNLIQMAKKSNINIISVSAFSEDSTTYKSGVITDEDYQELTGLDAVGDIAGVFINSEGNEINWSKHDLYMGIPISILKKADNLICVAAGKEKSGIIKLTVDQDYFNILVIDELLAGELL